MQDDVLMTTSDSVRCFILVGFARHLAQASTIGWERRMEKLGPAWLCFNPSNSKALRISSANCGLAISTLCPNRRICLASRSAGLTEPAVVTKGSVTKSRFTSNPQVFLVSVFKNMYLIRFQKEIKKKRKKTLALCVFLNFLLKSD